MTASLFQNPELLTAWATVGLFATTLLVGGATCLLIWTGMRQMLRSSDRDARDRCEVREADLRRHKKVVEEGRWRYEEAIAALPMPVRRTAPPAAPHVFVRVHSLETSGIPRTFPTK